MSRISVVYNQYAEEYLTLKEAGEATNALTAEMALADYNFAMISSLYELDSVEFVECYADVADMDEEDILYNLLINVGAKDEHECK